MTETSSENSPQKTMPVMTAHEPVYPPKAFPVPRESRTPVQRWIHRAVLTGFVALALGVVGSQAYVFFA